MNNPPSARLALRLIVDGSADVADQVWRLVLDATVVVAVSIEFTVRPYSKFPDCHEVSGVLVPIGDLDSGYEAVARQLATGWAEDSDDRFARWSVWNRGDGEFVARAVRWAHLELIRV